MIEERDALMYDVYKYTIIVMSIAFFVIVPFFTFYFLAEHATNNHMQDNHPVIINNQNNTNNINNNKNSYATINPNRVKIITNKTNITVTPRPNIIKPSVTVYNPVIFTVTPNPNYHIPINNQTLDEFDYLTCNGLNTNYEISKTLVYNKNTQIPINFSITNLKSTPIHSLTATITIAEYIIDNNTNKPVIEPKNSTSITTNNLNIIQYQDYNIQDIYTAPNKAINYLLICNINADNGANIHLQEIITIK